ncbi:MAG: leucyl aminopeptidase [Epsilonproteobacteria bacterium]|nr:leucyl aminopeptidase [Campylobacterota bacterium]
MLNVALSQKKFWDNDVEGYILLLDDKLSSLTPEANLEHIEQNYYTRLKDILKKHQFEGKKGQSFVLTESKNDKLIQFIFIGVGSLPDSWDRNLEILRRAIGSGIGQLKRLSIQNAVVALPAVDKFNVNDTELLKQLVITAYMADYEFITFKTGKKGKEWNGKLFIAVDSAIEQEHFIPRLTHGQTIGQAMNMARHWADLPANILTPTELAKQAQELADKHGLKATIFGQERAQELGMGAFLSVDRGSEQEGKFIVLEYHTDKKDAPTIALCGKGVMFDTGGISLKPSNYMTGMKYDMSGAAAVLATMSILSVFKPKVNVVGITPLVENMPGGNASRQDDVVTALNGKTIEIQNTDAEGRLILADALCYAEKFYSPEIIIDIATLTGACVHALGHFYSGIMGNDEALSKKLVEAGTLTGDRVWPLPFDEDYKKSNDSDVADVNNSGSRAYLAGTIIGACFLSEFVDKAKWAHIDIAGTSNDVPAVNYLGKGATGAGIRLLTEFVMSYK